MKRILQGLVSNGLLESVPGRTRYTAVYQLTEIGKKAAQKNLNTNGLNICSVGQNFLGHKNCECVTRHPITPMIAAIATIDF
jgi:hypothetical protein